MRKAKIIIADAEYRYIVPLQLQFARTFMEHVELEVITDKEYFNTLFATPQNIDVLIVSDVFYSAHLLRHSISKIFLMTEFDENGETANLSMVKIKKYTNPKDIFEEIIEKTIGILDIDTKTESSPKIITFYSARGGAGKTTLSIGASTYLARQNKKVLYINADRIQAFQYLLGIQDSINQLDIHIKLEQSENPYTIIKPFIKDNRFQYLLPFKTSIMSMGISYRIYEQIAVIAKESGLYDYVIVDADTTFDEKKATLLQSSDKVVLVTRIDENNMHSLNALIDNINDIGTEKYVCVGNDNTGNGMMELDKIELLKKINISDYIGYIHIHNENYCESLNRNSEIKKLVALIS